MPRENAIAGMCRSAARLRKSSRANALFTVPYWQTNSTLTGAGWTLAALLLDMQARAKAISNPEARRRRVGEGERCDFEKSMRRPHEDRTRYFSMSPHGVIAIPIRRYNRLCGSLSTMPRLLR
ncbi:MAG: hypothetical protein ABIS51_03690 [Sphingomonas sp.]